MQCCIIFHTNLPPLRGGCSVKFSSGLQILAFKFLSFLWRRQQSRTSEIKKTEEGGGIKKKSLSLSGQASFFSGNSCSSSYDSSRRYPILGGYPTEMRMLRRSVRSKSWSDGSERQVGLQELTTGYSWWLTLIVSACLEWHSRGWVEFQQCQKQFRQLSNSALFSSLSGRHFSQGLARVFWNRSQILHLSRARKFTD